jgi:hypothetical protein
VTLESVVPGAQAGAPLRQQAGLAVGAEAAGLQSGAHAVVQAGAEAVAAEAAARGARRGEIAGDQAAAVLLEQAVGQSSAREKPAASTPVPQSFRRTDRSRSSARSNSAAPASAASEISACSMDTRPAPSAAMPFQDFSAEKRAASPARPRTFSSPQTVIVQSPGAGESIAPRSPGRSNG